MTRQGVICAGVSCLDMLLHGTEPLATRESLSLVERIEYRPGGVNVQYRAGAGAIGSAGRFHDPYR